MPSFDSLFCSQERMAVLRFLLFRSNLYFTEAELSKSLSKKMLNGGRTLRELEKLGAVKKLRNSDTGEYVYRANKHWLLYDEFRALFVKAQLLIENDIERKLPRLGSIRLFVLTGMFVGDHGAPTDILIVGKINQRALSNLVTSFEEEIGQEVNYTALSMSEYQFRRNVGDRFLHNITDNRHVVIANYLETAPPVESDMAPSVKLSPPKQVKKTVTKKSAKKTKPKKKIVAKKKTTKKPARKRVSVLGKKKRTKKITKRRR